MSGLKSLVEAWVRATKEEKENFYLMVKDARREERLAGRFQKQAVPSELRWQIWVRDGFLCHYCGKQHRLSIDHKIPESKGGKTDLENLVTACRSCNAKKGSMSYEAFKSQTPAAA